MATAIQKTRAEIDKIICDSYGEIGGDIRDVAHVRPQDDDWEDPILFEVTLKDARLAYVARKDIDSDNNQAIKDSLREFR